MTPPDWLAMAELCLDMEQAWPEYERLMAIHVGPDGYGSGSGERGSVGVASNPTALAVMRIAGGKDALSGDDQTTPDTWLERSDRVAVLVSCVLAEAEKMAEASRRLGLAKLMIDKRGDARYGRQSSLQADCLACDKPVSGVGNDRLRSGYCCPCHSAWVRFRMAEMAEGRDANHEQFRRRRRKYLQSQKEQAS